MTAWEMIGTLMGPVGLLMTAGVVYWIATRPERPRHPAE